MIKAGALFYAIVVSLIIAIASSSLLLFSYTSRIHFDNAALQEQVIRNTGSGMQLLLSEQELVLLNSEKTFDLFGKGTDSVKLVRKAWGAHEVLISKAFFRKNSKTITALCGFVPDSNKISLYLADQDKPLAVCGKTLLKGTVFLPKAGIKRAYIEGQNFTGAQMVEGEIRTSSKALPVFDRELEAQLRKIFSDKMISDNDSIVIIGNEWSVDSMSNSFHNRTITCFSEGSLTISSGAYTGNIAIIANGKLKVRSEVSLNNIILIAPHITLEKGLKGSFQAFASDSIIAGKEVVLEYPSVLGILKSKASRDAAIVLEEKDSVSGSIFVLTLPEDQQSCGVMMKKESYMMGQVYSAGYADHQGRIHGSLICKSILLRTPSSVYENHLLGAVIDASLLSRHYAGIVRVSEHPVKKIIRYLP